MYFITNSLSRGNREKEPEHSAADIVHRTCGEAQASLSLFSFLLTPLEENNQLHYDR